MTQMTLEKVMELYHAGFDCSQVTFGYGCDLLGVDPEIGYRAGACFGGGMFRGETCGCVTGSLMAIGMKYGHTQPNDQETKQALMQIKKEFEDGFIEEHGSLICREILGYDIGTPEGLETIVQKGLLDSVCPALALTACELLDELL